MAQKCVVQRELGTAFVLLCVMHSHLGKELMSNKMKQRKIPLKRFITCLKLYLAYEHWVTEPHSRAQVRHSYKVLGELIDISVQFVSQAMKHVHQVSDSSLSTEL